MSVKLRIFSGLLALALVLGIGGSMAPWQNSNWVSPAYADTVNEYGLEGYPGQSINLTNVASGSGDSVLLEQNAWGGNGGQGDDSNSAGQGGNASSILDDRSGASYGTSSTSYTVQAQGGSGGYGYANSSGAGGQGGDAQAGFYFKGSGDFSGTAIATGGGGGAGTLAGNGAAGGPATLDPVYGESTNGGTVNVRGIATQGSGGGAGLGNYGPWTGSGANGATITLNNVVDGNTTGSLTISQDAVAGSGGGVYYGSGNGGQAGTADSVLSYTKDASYLKLYTYAAGGSGGGANYFLNVGDGADGKGGTATTEATNTGGAARAEAIAGGGSGGSSVYGGTGHGGTANATAQATSTTSYADAVAWATGGDGGWGITGGAGAAATSTAQGTSAAPIRGGDGNWYAGSVTSDAYSGDGGHSQDGSGGAGGAATAQSTYTYTGSQNAGASVSAGAQGGMGGQSQTSSGGAGGDATATATGNAPSATGLSVNSGASGGVGGYSYTGNHGQGGAALATSTGTAAMGLVSSNATSYSDPSGSGPIAVVVGQAGAVIANGGTSVSVSGTNEGSINKNLMDAQGKQAAAFGTVLPTQDSLAPLLVSNPQVQAAFSQDSTVLGYGVLGRTAASISDSTYNSSLTYNYNVADISNPQHLLVGLLDSSFSGSGDGFQLDFQIWGDYPSPLYTQSFTDPGQALSFFDDRVLDLGLLTILPTNYGKLDLNFKYTLVAAEGTSFNFNFIEGSGNPVPVPASVLLLGSGLLGLLALGRRPKRS